MVSKLKMKFRYCLVMLVINTFFLWKIYFKKEKICLLSLISGGNLFYKYKEGPKETEIIFWRSDPL